MANDSISSYNKYVFSIKDPDSIFSVSQGEVLCVKGEEGALVIRSALLDVSLSHMKRMGIFDHSFQIPSIIKKWKSERIFLRADEITVEGIFYAFDVRDSIKNIAPDATFGEVTGLRSSLVSYLRQSGSYQCDSEACTLQETNLELIIKNTVSLNDAADELLYVVVEEYESKDRITERFDDYLLWKLREERKRGVRRVVIDRSLERLGEDIQDEDLLRGKKSLGVVLGSIPSSTESLHEKLETSCREAIAESAVASRVVLYVFTRGVDTEGFVYLSHAQLSASLTCVTCNRSFSFRETRHTPGEAILEECTEKSESSVEEYTFPELHVDTFALRHLSQSIGEIQTKCFHQLPEEAAKKIEKYKVSGLDSIPLSLPWSELTDYQKMMCYLSRFDAQNLEGYVFIIDTSIISRSFYEDFYTSIKAVKRQGAIVILLHADEIMKENVFKIEGHRVFDFRQGRFCEEKYGATSKGKVKHISCNEEVRRTVSAFSGNDCNGGIVRIDARVPVPSGGTSPSVYASLTGSQMLLRGKNPNLFLALGIKGTVFSCDVQMLVDTVGIFGETVSLFSKTLKARVDGVDNSDFHPGGSLSCSICMGKGYFLEESILGYQVADICLHCKGTSLSEKSDRYQSMGVTMSDLLQMKIAEVLKILEGERVFHQRLSILNHFELGSIPLGTFFFSLQKKDKVKFLFSLAAILSESSPIALHAENIFSEITPLQQEYYFELLNPWFSTGRSTLLI
jgi:hypothetical protein